MIKEQDVKANGIKTVQTNTSLSQEKNQKLEALKKLVPNLVNSDHQVDTKALQDFIDIAQTTSNNKGYELTFAGKGIARAKADTETEFELHFEPTQSKIPHQVRNDDNRTVIAGDDPQSQPHTQGHCGLKPAPTHTQGHCGLKPAPTHTQGHCGLPPQPHTQGHCGLDPQSQNTVIRGDNLEVLKILKQNYFEKIKMIYIDPPYNTKSENFIYNDNFKQSEEELIENFGLDENTTNFLQNVYGTRSHSGWLAFMYPRLKLARDLLKEDGVIFISIDDNEQANLKIICDEIFGEENFVGDIIWHKKTQPSFLSNEISNVKEHILFYKKSENSITTFGGLTNPDKKIELINVSNKETERDFNHTNVLFNKGSFNGILAKGKYGNHPLEIELLEDIEIRNGKSLSNFTLKGRFKWSQKKINESFSNGDIFLLTTKTLRPIIEPKDKKVKIKPILDLLSKKFNYSIGTNTDGTNEIASIFKQKELFTNPKSTNLIKYLIKSITGIENKNDLILDFFAGSGTTGDAVMQLNAEDGGTRKFILVQWDEAIKKNTEAFKFCKENNFEPVISSITIERLNRAGERLQNKSAMTRKGDSTQPKSHFASKSHSVLDAESLFKDEMADQVRHEDKQKVIAGFDPQSQLHIGYKVFSLTKKPKLAEQGGLFRLVNERKTIADTLYNMLCATGKPLHTPFTELIKDRLYLVEEIPHQVRNDDNQTVIAGNDRQSQPHTQSHCGLDPQSQPHAQSHCGLDPQSQKHLYVLGEISLDKWETVGTNTRVCPIDECQIYIDGYSDISLENWLNLQIGQKENITVVY